MTSNYCLLTCCCAWCCWIGGFGFSCINVWRIPDELGMLVEGWDKTLVLVTVLTAPDEINFCNSAADIIFVCDAGWIEVCKTFVWVCCFTWFGSDLIAPSVFSDCRTMTRWTWFELCWLFPDVTVFEDATICDGPKIETTNIIYL